MSLMSLVNKAKKAKVDLSHSSPCFKFKESEIQLALAYLRDEVTLKQVQKALGHKNKGGSQYQFLLRALKAAHRDGHIS